jgi:hypothetical protein
MVGSGKFRPEFGLLASGDGGQMSPDSGAAWILTTDHCRIPTIGYQTCVQGQKVYGQTENDFC